MNTLSEISEALWQIWFDEQQKVARPIVEKMIREKLDLDESFKITWTPYIALREEQRGGGSMTDPKKWWLISDQDVQAIRKGLTGELLHALESGLHKTDEIPEDWK